MCVGSFHVKPRFKRQHHVPRGGPSAFVDLRMTEPWVAAERNLLTQFSNEGMGQIMKRLLFAFAALVPLVATGCGQCSHWLDATFCQPCNKGHLVGGCWGGQCGLGDEGCSNCVRGQGGEIIEGEVMPEGDVMPEGGMVYEGEGFGGEYASGGCDCQECQTRRHGHRGRGGRRGGGGFNPNANFGGAGGMPTAQVAYPYYTTRAPRDFLNPNPRSIGR